MYTVSENKYTSNPTSEIKILNNERIIDAVNDIWPADKSLLSSLHLDDEHLVTSKLLINAGLDPKLMHSPNFNYGIVKKLKENNINSVNCPIEYYVRCYELQLHVIYLDFTCTFSGNQGGASPLRVVYDCLKNNMNSEVILAITLSARAKDLKGKQNEEYIRHQLEKGIFPDCGFKGKENRDDRTDGRNTYNRANSSTMLFFLYTLKKTTDLLKPDYLYRKVNKNNMLVGFGFDPTFHIDNADHNKTIFETFNKVHKNKPKLYVNKKINKNNKRDQSPFDYNGEVVFNNVITSKRISKPNRKFKHFIH